MTSEERNWITKKQAAIEVYKQCRLLLISGIVAIISLILALVLPGMSRFVVSIFPIGAAGLLIHLSARKMNKLNKKYDLGFNQISWNGYNVLDYQNSTGGGDEQKKKEMV